MAKLNIVQRRPSYLSLYSKARRLEQAEEEKTDEENIEEVTELTLPLSYSVQDSLIVVQE
jgi:hypothetical protein